MPRLDQTLDTAAMPSMEPFGAFRPREHPQATPHPGTATDAPLMQRAHLRVGAGQLPELLALLPDLEAAHARALERLEEAERAHAVALADGSRAERYQRQLDMHDRERQESTAFDLVRRTRQAIEFHRRRLAMAERRERFLAEASGEVAEAG